MQLPLMHLPFVRKRPSSSKNALSNVVRLRGTGLVIRLSRYVCVLENTAMAGRQCHTCRTWCHLATPVSCSFKSDLTSKARRHYLVLVFTSVTNLSYPPFQLYDCDCPEQTTLPLCSTPWLLVPLDHSLKINQART